MKYDLIVEIYTLQATTNNRLNGFFLKYCQNFIENQLALLRCLKESLPLGEASNGNPRLPQVLEH